MSDKTERLKLETPVAGTFGWHVEWGRNMETLDNHPGILICTSTTRPENPWQGQVIFETDTKQLMLFDGEAWRSILYASDPPDSFNPTVLSLFRFFCSVNSIPNPYTAPLPSHSYNVEVIS